MNDVLAYRVSAGQQLAVRVAIGCFVALGLGLLVVGGVPWGNRIGSAVAALIAAVLLHRFTLHLSLKVTETSVTVTTPVRTFSFPTAELIRASGGRLLTLHLARGATVRVLAVTNTNVTVALRRDGRTEAVAHEINQFLSRAPNRDAGDAISGRDSS